MNKGQSELAKAVEDQTRKGDKRLGKAERDIVALGIAVAAIILFLGSTGSLFPQMVRAWSGSGAAPDALLINAVFLNIALLIFGWRRYKDLQCEVEERRKAEERAREMAETDALTGCLNRRSGAPAIDKLLLDASRMNREVVVFMIDLDNFKQINDLNGHQAGDKVLVTLAERLRDAFPPGAIIARIGGDEFVCSIALEAGAEERIEQIAQGVTKALSTPVEHAKLVLDPAASMGIASSSKCVSRNSTIDAETLMHRADIAMYHAKKNGKGAYFWFEPQMEEELRFRNELETSIRRGIMLGEFVPYYEQQIDLESGKLAGFEMLARWKSPEYGLVSPDVFIPVAEEIDMISELSECLLKQAFQDAKDWDPRLTLSVNISPLQLRDPWFSQRLLHLLIESGFAPSRLEIEITESCLHENIGAVRTIVTSLKNQGISISLDDFGTGYSSLAQLRSLPFDRLKIDRSFVAEMAKDGGSSDLVEAIISLGKGLDLPVTAEGIEDSNSLDTLRKMGQLNGQGYLYGKPEDADATRKRLEEMSLLTQAEDRGSGDKSGGDEAAKTKAGDDRKAG